MKIKGLIFTIFVLILLPGCDKQSNPDMEGLITLSSQLFGTSSYYLFGYHFEDSEMYRYRSQTDPLPDIINEGILVIDGTQQRSLPGFNTPERVNGFALVGEFSSLNEAENFYMDYQKVEDGLQYVTVSDTVKLFQVWVQHTSADNYAKMLIREIHQGEGSTGVPYNEVTLSYQYSNDGSAVF